MLSYVSFVVKDRGYFYDLSLDAYTSLLVLDISKIHV